MNRDDTGKVSLLIIDDVPANLKVLFNCLDEQHYEVRIAENGANGLAQVAYAPPDLILLDVMMPKIDGFETCRRLKADPKTRDIPVIFMTALSDTADKIKGFEAGAVDYITKPIQHKEVLARVHTHLTLRQLQQSMQQKNLELNQQNKELEAFAHTVAHDLKNHANGVRMITKQLLDSFAHSPNSETQQLLQFLDQAGTNITNTIEALLLLASARIEEVPMQPLNMAEAVDKTLQRLVLLIEEHCGDITVPETWPAAVGYAPWIEEVWTNYISNALKYGGKPPRLELSAASGGEGQVRFQVRDNGPGLTPEQQSRLFVPFTRITQARVKGHGLGLSIVQRVIEKSGGQAGVESQAGQGSVFYFTLPATKEL
ncbi:MAG: response regulator [Gammaproteobacteria bacterium]|nr:response regulator [Gammaproteobacteria bacterium]